MVQGIKADPVLYVLSRIGDPPRDFLSYVHTNLRLVSFPSVYCQNDNGTEILRLAARRVQEGCVSVPKSSLNYILNGSLQSNWVKLLSMGDVIWLTEDPLAHF